MRSIAGIHHLRLNFLMALIATTGSLYFSEVMKFPPCTLCWYQRICLYPLVVIFGAALLTDDHRHWKYSAPLILLGGIIAFYHNLLYFGIVPQEIIPCTGTVSCSSKQLELFGFITIPMLALMGFVTMGVIVVWESMTSKEKNDEK